MKRLFLRKLAAPLLSASALFFLSACVGAPVEPTKEEKLGELYLQAGLTDVMSAKFPDAIRSLNQATKFLPKSGKAWDALGIAYFGKKEMRRSEEAFRRALAVEPTFTQARLNLAALLVEVKRYPDARKELELVRKDVTFNMQDKTYLNYGMIELNLNNLAGAEKFFARATEENHSNCIAWLRLGDTRAKLGKTSASFDAYRNASTGLCYSFAEGNYQFGAALANSDETDTAKEKLNEVVSRFPNTYWAKMARDRLRLLTR